MHVIRFSMFVWSIIWACILHAQPSVMQEIQQQQAAVQKLQQGKKLWQKKLTDLCLAVNMARFASARDVLKLYDKIPSLERFIGLELRSVKTLDDLSYGSSGLFTEKRWRLEAYGDFNQLGEFISKIEKFRKIVSITHLQLIPSGNKKYNLTLEWSVFQATRDYYKLKRNVYRSLYEFFPRPQDIKNVAFTWSATTDPFDKKSALLREVTKIRNAKQNNKSPSENQAPSNFLSSQDPKQQLAKLKTQTEKLKNEVNRYKELCIACPKELQQLPRLVSRDTNIGQLLHNLSRTFGHHRAWLDQLEIKFHKPKFKAGHYTWTTDCYAVGNKIAVANQLLQDITVNSHFPLISNNHPPIRKINAGWGFQLVMKTRGH